MVSVKCTTSFRKVEGRFIDGVASNGLAFRGTIQSNGQLRYFPKF